ncbi:hypothetical protein [Litchfieldia alkalitelluris]|uniref:hypothetical protein n=1 Tax=Litchfieldia alkalitelluris TaxID=304268 RepID=UPI000995EC06|nr:hypothetical protein [Litchfieldia alkalitelluris]
MKSKTIQNYEKLKMIYETNLSVDLLAEDIYTCNLNDEAISIKTDMIERDFDVYGVEEKGKILGYVLKENLSNGSIKNVYNPFRSEELISDSTSLIELLDILKDRKYLFILEKNKVSKIITIADLHKQPIRMLAFSLISLLEMLLITLIRETYPNESWKDHLSSGRIAKAEEMLSKRIQKNEALTLLDNTQLSDKGTIVYKSPDLYRKLGFESTTKCKEFFNHIETLRNNTAHAQEEIYHDHQELIDIILQVNMVLDRNANRASE